MKEERKYSSAHPNHPRVHKVTFMLNDEEHKAVKRYLSRYKIENKSRWYRETILSHILKTLEEDYPTLFNENEMSEGEVPVGAVIVCNNQIIARAHNQTECLNDVTAHAEMLAITAATGVLGAKYLTNCSLYVTVEPCIMCAGAIGWAQLSTIVYGASDDKRGFSKFAPQAFHPKAIIKKGILEKECAEEMQRFFKQRR